MTMRDDDAIERVMAGLGRVQPPAGIEDRVLRAMDSISAAKGAAPGRRLIGLRGFYVVSGIAVACLLILATRFGAVVHPAIQQSVPPKMEAATPRVSPKHVGGDVLKVRVAVARAYVRPAVDVSDDDALALAEMQAPSHPAPPVPLTEEERMLLRIAHPTTLMELAMVDPVLLKNEDAREKAEYEEFFAPPKAVAQDAPNTPDEQKVAPGKDQPQ